MVRNYRSLYKSQRQGSAALITTIAISSILVVLFIGITAIATREIRQSINADNSNRALYAAEAGVEDAVRQLSNDPAWTEPTCNSQTSGKEVTVSTGTDATNTAWVCRTVTQFNTVLQGHLSKDESLQVDLTKSRIYNSGTGTYTAIPNNASVRYMTVEWNNPKVDAAVAHGTVVGQYANHFLPPYLTENNAFPNSWGGRAAALELTASWYKNENLGPGDLKGGVFPVRTAIATPVCPEGTTECTTTDFSPLNGNSPSCTTNTGNTNAQSCFPNSSQNPETITQGSLQSRLSVSCTNNATVEYSCKIPHNATPGVTTPLLSTTYDLANLTKTEFKDGGTIQKVDNCPNWIKCTVMIRMKARYAGASYRLQFYYGDGSVAKPVSITDGYATIDVTARSNGNFRRVQAKKKMTPTVFDGIFDNSVFSGSTVCKTMTVDRNFQGLPEFVQSPPGFASPNPNRGRNTGCGPNSD